MTGTDRMTSLTPDHEERLARARFAVGGMSCSACAHSVEKALLAVPGVESAVVNIAAEAAAIRYDATRADEKVLIEAIEKAGYHAKPGGDAAEPSLHKERLGLYAAAALALPIILIYQGLAPIPNGPIVLLVLATILQFTAGLRFYRGAYYSLRSGVANMDVLVALGITAAWGYSVLVTLFPSRFAGAETFFDMAALLILFIRFGKMLEARAKGRANDAMRALLRSRPGEARLVEGDGEREVSVEELRAGDLFRVRPGDLVPVDGEVVEGESSIDEAAVSGESVPVTRRPGDAVTGGTVVIEGNLVVRATAVGDETFLSRMIRMVEEAQLDKAPIQRFADRVSNVFVPIVVLIAAVAFVIWFAAAGRTFAEALTRAVAVLVVACPCALGLATPTAILVGSGVGLRRGILFKRGSVLEAIARIRYVLFNKTGTITEGKPVVTDIAPAEGTTEESLLTLAASGAALTNHPLAQAVVETARGRGVSFEGAAQSMELPGRGVRFVLDGDSALLGSAALCESEGVDLTGHRDQADEFADDGKSVLWLAVGGSVNGLFALRDEPKQDVADVIGRIKALGIGTALVTGDRARTAEAVAARVGIGQVYAEVLPDRKAEIVRAAKEEGRFTAMVGDGINDAPALAAADVGIAIGAGTDVAKEAGDVVLVHSDPADAAVAIELGRATVRKVKQNLFWALAYNVIMIPFAAGALAPWGLHVPPEIAALAMALSSVTVVTNSIDLRRWRPVGD